MLQDLNYLIEYNNFSHILTFIVLLRYQTVLFFAIAELATISEPSLRHWRKKLVKALTAARVDEKFCTVLMCQYDQSEEVGKLLADALSQFIKKRKPDRLEFDIPGHFACPLQQLRMFLGKVRKHHEGELLLELRHSYINYVACDDAIKALKGAR